MFAAYRNTIAMLYSIQRRAIKLIDGEYLTVILISLQRREDNDDLSLYYS